MAFTVFFIFFTMELYGIIHISVTNVKIQYFYASKATLYMLK